MKKFLVICLPFLICSEIEAFGDWISPDPQTIDHDCVFTVYKRIIAPKVPAGDTFARANASQDNATTIVFEHRPGFSLSVPNGATLTSMVNAPIFRFEPYSLKSFLSPDKYSNIRGAISEDGTLYEIGQHSDTAANTTITEIWAAQSPNWAHGTLIMKLRTTDMGISFIPVEIFASNHMVGIIAYCGMPGFSSLVILDPKAFVVRKYTSFSEYQLLGDLKTLWSKPPFTRADALQHRINLDKMKGTEEPLIPSPSS